MCCDALSALKADHVKGWLWDGNTHDAQGLERQAGDEHVLDERRSRNEVLELQVEDPLQALNAERSQLGQLAQQPAEVVRLALRFRVVGDVIPQAVNYFEL